MESCNVSKKKYRDSDSEYSHSGNGKLMFTNGLTLKEFEKNIILILKIFYEKLFLIIIIIILCIYIFINLFFKFSKLFLFTNYKF